MTRAARSYLYVPGDRPDLIAKAIASAADAVVIDLEDAVDPADRERARQVTAEATRPASDRIGVRINPAGSDEARRDLAALATGAPTFVRVAKCESPDDITWVAARLPGSDAGSGAGPGIQALIESARGVENVARIAAASPAVEGIALGEADLLSDLGCDPSGLGYSRMRCVVGARAAGLDVIIQSVHTAIGDDDGLRRSSDQGRALGFTARSAIHPAQLTAIHEAFTPSEDEVAAARRLVADLTASGATFVTADGHFVDPAVTARAHRTIRRADALTELARRNRP